MKKLLLLALTACLPGVGWAQFTAPKYSNEFLQIGVGARALAMGNTQAAIARDATAGYWNPAGLQGIGQTDVALMHAEYFAGIATYDFVGAATRIDSVSTLGATFIRFGVDDIPDTRFLYDADGRINYANLRAFSVADYALLLTYARKSSVPGLDLGANFKIVHRTVGTFGNAWGFGLDAGAQYRYKGWQLGLMLRDVTSTFNAWSFNTVEVELINAADSNNVIPENSIEVALPRAILGVARGFRIKEKFGVLASADLNLTFDGQRNAVVSSRLVSIDPTFGVELDYLQTVFLRGGFNNVQQFEGFASDPAYTSVGTNFGVGLRIKQRFYVDYALTNVGDLSGSLYSNIFSLRMSL